MRLLTFFSALPFVFAICFADSRPESRPEGRPEAHPEAEADPHAQPEAQEYSNYAPFSGVVYIVNGNGQAAQGACYGSAPLSCGNGWCCPGSCSCVAQQNGQFGCCPSGQNCGGAISVTTVTVTAQAQATANVYVAPASNENTVYQGGFCQTLTMHGAGLPVVTQGSCGTILIMPDSGRSLKPVGFGIAGVFLLTQVAIARVFRWI